MKKFVALLLGMTMLVSACSANSGTNVEKETAKGSTETTSTPSEVTTEGGKKYKIAINQFAEHPSLDNCRTGFIAGLEESLGKDHFTIDYKNAAADMAIANQIATTQASDGNDLICGIATPSAQASFNAAEKTNTPVIYIAVSDPAEAGLSDEKGLGQGITGTSDKLPLAEQLKLIRAVMPEAKTIGVLYTTSEINSVTQVEELKSIASTEGFTIEAMGVSSKSDIPQALDQLLPKVDCMTNVLDNTVVQSLSLVLAKAEEAKVPVFGSEIEQVKLGCVASAGIDYVELGKQTGKMAARVLNGEDINTIPFEMVKESKIYANQTALEAFGFVLPTDMNAEFVQADTNK